MILVCGGTGTLGARIVHGLLAQGKDVRVLVRHNPISAQMAPMGLAHTPETLIEAGAQPAWGDLKDRASLEAAVAGVDTVITTANSVKRGGEDTPETVDRAGTLNLIDAAAAAGVRRFLYTSVPDASPDSNIPVLRIKYECEEALRASGMAYTVIRPTIFMEVWIGLMVGVPLMMQQPITLIGQGNHAHNFISEQDVADYHITLLDHPQAYNRILDIGGPGSYSWTQIVERVGERMGTTLPVNYAPMGSIIPTLPEAANGLASFMETHESYLDMTETAATFGIRPTTLDEYIDHTFVFAEHR